MGLKHLLPVACAALAVTLAPPAGAETTAQIMPATIKMLSHAVSVRTAQGNGKVPELAKYFADKLKAAGFDAADIKIIPVGETAALTVRYQGTNDAAPIVIIGHMDVVPAPNAKAWKYPPFELTKANGSYYGRGVADMKGSVVTLVQTFMRLKREGFQPERTIVMALTGDEETNEFTIQKVAERYKNADFLLDAEGGGGVTDAHGNPVMYGVEAAEKGYTDFLLTTTSPGGHSSEPSAEHNAINRLSAALDRIAAYHFPVRHNEVSLTTLRTMAEHRPQGELTKAMRVFAANPDDASAAKVLTHDRSTVGLIRTTCIATELDAGHARNALPEKATANINCRVFPGATIKQVKNALIKVIDDDSVKITRRPPKQPPGPISKPRPDVMKVITATVHERYPKLEVVPMMIGASTDMKYTRLAGIPSYGIGPFFVNFTQVHAHGINEQLPAGEIKHGLDFWHSLIPRLGKL
ncbi:MAG TPA: M20/M25/M40 family metallo-hydrolase [Oleiagrimonas sp.]|nr:M20/M25/M40 family metallo-hydrolase [Oleiagrimonas sp.]